MDDFRDLNNILDEQGRVTVWPTKRRPRRQQRVREYLAAQFAFDIDYTEREVNALLNQYHTFGDWALLRRELCDFGLLKRTPRGTRYWRPRPDAAQQPPEV